MAALFYIHKQTGIILPYLAGTKTILDFGCGDLSLARAIKDARPRLSITGVDVVDSGVRYSDIPFGTYDGKRLPFKNDMFDTSIAYHVLHHCDDPYAAVGELTRVTKKQILLVEPVYRNAIDLFCMKILDRVNNGWRAVAIPMPFTFQKEPTWVKWAGEAGWKATKVISAGVLPAWLPLGATKLFVLRRSS